MATWKLSRQFFGDEEYTLKEGEKITVGRNEDNKIVLTSIVISRNHCVINVEHDKVLLTDLKSSNGVFVGTKKIPPNTPYTVRDSDVIGFGWITGARLVDIKNNEKFIFKLTQIKNSSSLIEKIKFQNDYEDIEAKVADLDGNFPKRSSSPLLPKLTTKRKSHDNGPNIKQEKHIKDPCVVDLISDSDNELHPPEVAPKKIKLEAIHEDTQKESKTKNDLVSEAFKVKEEYLGYDDEAIQIDSDSDSESDQWFMRLSQSSPGKPFVKVMRESKIEIKPEESSYSQVDDGLALDLNYPLDEEEEYLDDIIKIPTEPPLVTEDDKTDDDYTDEGPPLISIPQDDVMTSYDHDKNNEDEGIDLVDGGSSLNNSKTKNNSSNLSDDLLDKLINENIRRASLIEPATKISKPAIHHSPALSEKKSTSSYRKNKKRESVSKNHISNTQKEERKKRLKDIANKDKDIIPNEVPTSSDSAQTKKPVINVKITSSNRGAFLTDVGVVKPTKRKETSPKTKKSKDKSITDKKEKSSKKNSSSKSPDTVKSSKTKETTKPKSSKESHRSSIETRVSVKKLKPLTGDGESFSGKPCSKVEPLPASKPKKSVRFSEVPPQVRVFDIEPGNKMIKTSMVKTAHVDSLRKGPMFSLERLTLMRILRWNPHWLEEQLKTTDPPPILGADPPLTIFHNFKSHSQYVKLVGDLLLMEIWECLTQANTKIRNANVEIPMRIESLPPPPTHERYVDLINMSVNVSMPTSEIRSVPRMGEILLVTFGQESSKTLKFFYVHNVRNLPSPAYNKNSFFSISLQSIYTDKMKSLKPGELMKGRVLAYINKELMLFEAMEYLAKTPLCEAILRPTPQFFLNNNTIIPHLKNSKWTATLNESQHRAVSGAVHAALGDKPTIHMVQGPPGTGKSSVICAIVMSYFFDSVGKLERNRGKILICATSNAAVDELVIRLLDIRQTLPKSERFRMVRVGRSEAMHPRARDVSSLQLAARDLTRHEPAPDATHETAHLQAKINMWQTAAHDAKTPERVVYCQDKIQQLTNKINLLRSGSGSAGGQLPWAERRVIEKADIVATTLASAHNHKMHVLKGRIALCIIEEAGQALEAETLVPLTLDVTNLTLIGDPQQLPGYICSQRAKKHGLGESLFSRLTSCGEEWPTGSPVVLLNEQYRMHPEIADYPNRAFYDGKIVTCVDRSDELSIPPYMILGVSSGDKGQGSSGANDMEACAVSRVALSLLPAVRAKGYSFAVVSPYNAHKELIKKYLRMMYDGPEIEVNTVDSFQGQERDVVVASMARSSGAGFLTDAGRLNVMLTRARRHLLLCLHPHAMMRNNQWRTLVEDAQRRNLYTMLPNKMCQPITTCKIPNEEVLAYIKPPKHR